ncbi:hypothetical protein [Streptomyces sp. ID05-47C]|uniref:hypothetical protein n=1 Tax=Streptomyces sp. ID05-47C TaxID=3028665 RepID=UPI0029B4C1B2|nr:hypothetical protein [Streptomyces sp. ID05-47C]MDX3568185.1 hypothetical protein [Streptomyces sp. ID05-47C]
MPKVSKDKGSAWNAREAITFLRSARAHRLYAAGVLVLVIHTLWATARTEAAAMLPELLEDPLIG